MMGASMPLLSNTLQQDIAVERRGFFSFSAFSMGMFCYQFSLEGSTNRQIVSLVEERKAVAATLDSIFR
jgi:hypothetical protein